MNRRRWIGSFLAVTILATTGWYAWAPIAIFYHKQCIALANKRLDAISREKLAGNWIGNRSEHVWYARRVHHYDRLVALGYFFHASYELNNLPRSSFGMQRDAIMLSGMTTFPMSGDRYWSISTSDDYVVSSDTYRMVIDVYDLPQFKSQWEKFAKDDIKPTTAHLEVD